MPSQYLLRCLDNGGAEVFNADTGEIVFRGSWDAAWQKRKQLNGCSWTSLMVTGANIRIDRLEAAFDHLLNGLEKFCSVIGFPEDRDLAKRVIHETRAIRRGER